MDLKIEQGKAFIITGPQAGGKSSLALSMARNAGSFAVSSFEMLMQPFGLSSVMAKKPDTIIIEEFGCTEFDVGAAKYLVSSPQIRVEQLHKQPEIVEAPNFIFVAAAGVRPDLDPVNRRFIELAL